jgi:hypothetical protein
MSSGEARVSSEAELISAIEDADIRSIVILGDLTELSGFRLSPGQSLRGSGSPPALCFAEGQDGVQLTSDNHIEGLTLETGVRQRAIFNDTAVEHLGRLELKDVTTIGSVQILARDKVRDGHVEIETLEIQAADARGQDERPKGYGVEVLPGAFTLWNQQADASVTITARLTGLSVGRAGAPVRGTGVFVSGAGDTGGRVVVSSLETGAVHSDGGIPPATPDRITGGVFVVYGAYVDRVVNHGPVTTYGPNDMVLDNWGKVDRWTVDGKVTSHGPSAIGFVNFGTVNHLVVNAVIETFGQGSRGFNVYAGTVNTATFERVLTHGDGAVGVQISQPVGDIKLRSGIETYGGTGDSLVKGVVLELSATALSIKPGGAARSVTIAGGVITHGGGVSPIELHGMVGSLTVTDSLAAAGGGFETI